MNAVSILPAAQLVVQWDDNTTAETGFEIQRTVEGGAFVTVGTVAANVTRYVDRTVVPGAAYSYRVRAYNAFQSSQFSNTTSFVVPHESDALRRSDVGDSKLMNLSARAVPGSGENSVIVGFVVEGVAKSVLLRAVGPGIPGVHPTMVSPDPALTVHTHGSAVLQNDDWDNSPKLRSVFAQVGAFMLPPGSLDAALLADFSPGGNTVLIDGVSSGFMIAEIYDADPEISTGRLANFSVRARAEGGDGVLIVGFVIAGTAPMRVLLRASGPALSERGVDGVLADPQLTLFHNGDEWDRNDDWGGDTELSAIFAGVGAFPWLNPVSTDAALVVSLPPGAYTAVVSGADGGTGVTLAEVYQLP